MALFLEVTLIGELDHVLGDCFAGFIKRILQDHVVNDEGENDQAGLNGYDDIQGDDCFFHCWGVGMRLMVSEDEPL
jgi:hypothetical protein